MTIAEVKLWGSTIGAVSIADGSDVADFQYEESFAQSGIQVSPIVMPLTTSIYSFPGLARNSFHGLPGMLVDSLPDKFGTALIDAWLASKGRTPESFNAVERLCYEGRRGMGALEFEPSQGPKEISRKLEVRELENLASEVLSLRRDVHGNFAESIRENSLRDILRVGTSAGGARAKVVIAWNRSTNEVRSGQVDNEGGFEHWLLKFDGINSSNEQDLSDTKGFGAVEYAYYMMAKEAGIEMNECRLLEENGRRHFMTKRFDRSDAGEKLHMQSLGAMAHLDYNLAGAHSYEQAFQVMRTLNLPMESIEQQFRRMVFNIVARNQDDHVKNIAFLMNKKGEWFLSPAYDVTYSYNPQGSWTATHQMSMNNKRDGFELSDFTECAKTAGMKRGRAQTILEEVQTVVRKWNEFASKAKLNEEWLRAIASTHRFFN